MVNLRKFEVYLIPCSNPLGLFFLFINFKLGLGPLNSFSRHIGSHTIIHLTTQIFPNKTTLQNDIYCVARGKRELPRKLNSNIEEANPHVGTKG